MGEDIAKDLYKRNFKNIYLVTGYDQSQFQKLSFIKGVYGKEPIFDL